MPARAITVRHFAVSSAMILAYWGGPRFSTTKLRVPAPRVQAGPRFSVCARPPGVCRDRLEPQQNSGIFSMGLRGLHGSSSSVHGACVAGYCLSLTQRINGNVRFTPINGHTKAIFYLPLPTGLGGYAAATFASTKGRLIRCTVPGSTPNCAAILPPLCPGQMFSPPALTTRHTAHIPQVLYPSTSLAPGGCMIYC